MNPYYIQVQKAGIFLKKILLLLCYIVTRIVFLVYTVQSSVYRPWEVHCSRKVSLNVVHSDRFGAFQPTSSYEMGPYRRGMLSLNITSLHLRFFAAFICRPCNTLRIIWQRSDKNLVISRIQVEIFKEAQLVLTHFGVSLISHEVTRNPLSRWVLHSILNLFKRYRNQSSFLQHIYLNYTIKIYMHNSFIYILKQEILVK